MGREVYLRKSNRPEKKYAVTVYGGCGKRSKTIHFGQAGASDYTKHKDASRMKRYANRHSRKENWGSSGICTAGFWSKNLLWSEPSLAQAKRKISSRYGVRFISSPKRE